MRPKSGVNLTSRLDYKLTRLGVSIRWRWRIIHAYCVVREQYGRTSKHLFFLRPSRWQYAGRPSGDHKPLFRVETYIGSTVFLVIAGFVFLIHRTPRVPKDWTFDAFDAIEPELRLRSSVEVLG